MYFNSIKQTFVFLIFLSYCICHPATDFQIPADHSFNVHAAYHFFVAAAAALKNGPFYQL